jgi:DNA repair photolyase
MEIKEINAKTLLRKHNKIDSWFLSRYGMNLYRGCRHNCTYCDGRAEKYNVEGEFGSDVAVKINAIDVLRHELDPRRKRIPLKPGYIMVGGGVGDSYQPIEEKYELTRKTLFLLAEKKFPVHILTKSTLVKRDIDIIEKINEKSKAIVSFSFSSTNEKISKIFEPNVPRPNQRLETIQFFKDRGISCGMFLLPVIPFISDTKDVMEKTIQDARDVGIEFIIFGGMTLKEGKQKEYFLNILKQHYPQFITEYNMIYKDNRWGNAIHEYYNQLHKTFNVFMKYYKIPKRIPLRLFKNIISKNDLVVVLLEHIDYLLKLEGKKSPYGYAAYSVSKLKQPISNINNLKQIKGVGSITEKIILDIIETGTSKYYENLLK